MIELVGFCELETLEIDATFFEETGATWLEETDATWLEEEMDKRRSNEDWFESLFWSIRPRMASSRSSSFSFEVLLICSCKIHYLKKPTKKMKK